MTPTKLREIIKKGEGLHTEFKESKRAINKDIYETICAFLNRNGGELLLGVNGEGNGVININNYSPFPKNPNISSFFRQIFYAEELGSGFNKIAKYSKAYFGTDPVIQEKDVFKFEVQFKKNMMEIMEHASLLKGEPLNESSNEPLKLSNLEKHIINRIKQNPKVTKDELVIKLEKSRSTISRELANLKNKELIKREGSKKKGKWIILKESAQ